MNLEGSFGNWLRQRRKALDLTQADLAEQVGCSVMTVRKIEADHRRPSKQIAERMADTLVVSRDERPAFVAFARQVPLPPTLPSGNGYASTRHKLPLQSTPFVGRETELEQIAERQTDPACRLLTLVGPGGIGKSRLALQAATEQRDKFPHGVYFVSLASVGLPDLIASTIASTLNISFFGSIDPVEQIINYMRDKRILLILDNFEHLLNEVRLLITLLTSAPGLKILATSRERLNLDEEWVLPIDGLPFPSTDKAEKLDSYHAVQLFMQRARRMQPGFLLDGNQEAIIAICQAVEGMPLALELAATWLRAMPCQQIAEQIRRDLDFLITPLHNVPERHRSMRAVFDYSWELLSSAECQVLAKLSVFRGGCDLEAAQYVTGASLTMLANLVDKSLLRLSATGRYEMHELLRQFAADKLVESGEVTETEQRHFEYFCALAEQLEGWLYGPQYTPTLNRYEVEHNNFRAALDWTVRVGDIPAGLRLAGALGWFWRFRYHLAEGREWLTRLLAVNQTVAIDVRAKAIFHATIILWAVDDHYCVTLAEEALALVPAVENLRLKAWLLYTRGEIENLQSERRRELFQEALTLFQQVGDNWGINFMLLLLGQNAFQCSEFERALVLLEEGIRMAHHTGDKQVLSYLTLLTGCAYYYQGADCQQMKTHYQESLNLFRELGDKHGTQTALLTLGKVALREEDDTQARLYYEKSLALAPDIGNSWATISGLVGMGIVWCVQGKPARAARLFGTVRDYVKLFFPGPSNLEKDNRMEYERGLCLAQSLLDEEAFEAALAEGRTMTLQQAVAYALGCDYN